MIRLRNDTLCGLLFIAIAIAFGWAATGYDLGTARRMGPGYFPLLTAAVLGAFGLAILGRDLLRAGRGLGEDGSALPVPWGRGLLVMAGILFFAATASGLGLVPALVVTVLLSSRAGANSWRQSLMQAVVLTVMCTVIFQMGLGLKLPLIGPWLGGV